MRSLRTSIAPAILAVALGAAACTTPEPSAPGPSAPGPSGPAASATSATPSQQPSPAANGEPGRPYDAAEILAAMRDSRRPGGVAEELQTQEIASRVADQLWTWDGTRWSTLAIGGTCGAEACGLEVTGASDGSAGSDAYAFSIIAASGEVQLTAADLHAYPTELEGRLDEVARAGIPAASLEGMALIGARWLPPPDTGRYWLSYRSGGEEGSPGLDVLVDLPAGTVIETRAPG